ncbi:MAG: hypothetical protein Terrestrivirus2_35 [Terrestrivirus sp.]|uniref:Uncharacterized protein n=1 Tax=Terrestrivirus sp. TaxID=2487775 RepID=A0A3G4ZL15_9VIRU|nr:MAG: hypothetical protein Terrestrivirus2_35 [Terrestrivirus sp.]
MDIKSYNTYIVSTINNEVQKQVKIINSHVQEQITIELHAILNQFRDPISTRNRDFVNGMFQLISDILRNNNNNYDLSEIKRSLQKYVDERVAFLASTPTSFGIDGINPTGLNTILSQIANEVAILLDKNDMFAEHMEHVIVQYFDAKPTLKYALNNKIKNILENDQNIGEIVINMVSDRLDHELTGDIQKKLTDTIMRMAELIVPRFIESITNIKLQINDINIFRTMIIDLIGETTENKPKILHLYDTLRNKISVNYVQYCVPIIEPNTILLSSLISMDDPLNAMIDYIFVLDIILHGKKSLTENNMGDMATKYIGLIDEIFNGFAPTVSHIINKNNINNTNSMNNKIHDTQNILSINILNKIIQLLWDFMKHITLLNTKIVLNRRTNVEIVNHPVNLHARGKYGNYDADDNTIDFLFSVIKLYIEKIKLNLIEATMFSAHTTDNLMYHQMMQYRGITTRLL